MFHGNSTVDLTAFTEEIKRRVSSGFATRQLVQLNEDIQRGLPLRRVRYPSFIEKFSAGDDGLDWVESAVDARHGFEPYWRAISMEDTDCPPMSEAEFTRFLAQATRFTNMADPELREALVTYMQTGQSDGPPYVVAEVKFRIKNGKASRKLMSLWKKHQVERPKASQTPQPAQQESRMPQATQTEPNIAEFLGVNIAFDHQIRAGEVAREAPRPDQAVPEAIVSWEPPMSPPTRTVGSESIDTANPVGLEHGPKPTALGEDPAASNSKITIKCDCGAINTKPLGTPLFMCSGCGRKCFQCTSCKTYHLLTSTGSRVCSKCKHA
jgi:hypothetical protein